MATTGSDIRPRFWRIRQAAVVACTVVIAMITAMLGAGFGAWAGWHTAPRLPEVNVTDGYLAAAFPGVRIRGDSMGYGYPFGFGGPCDYDNPLLCILAGGEYGYSPESRLYDVGIPDTKARALLASAAARLRAAGWRVAAKTDVQPNFYGFTAAKSDVVLNVVAALLSGPTRVISIWFEADRSTDPPLVPVGMVAGLLAGAAGGWLAAAWAIRRGRRLSRNGRILAAVAFAYALAAAAPGTLESVVLLRTYVFAHEPNLAIWESYVAGAGRAPGMVSVVITAGLLVALIGWRTGKKRPESVVQGADGEGQRGSGSHA